MGSSIRRLRKKLKERKKQSLMAPTQDTSNLPVKDVETILGEKKLIDEGEIKSQLLSDELREKTLRKLSDAISNDFSGSLEDLREQGVIVTSNTNKGPYPHTTLWANPEALKEEGNLGESNGGETSNASNDNE